jgi:UDP-glucuronate decarboxylase
MNFGNPEEYSILHLAERVRALVGGEAAVVHRPLPQDDPRRRRPDIARARRILGWRPTTTLGAGLPPTIRWFRAHLATAGGTEVPLRGAGRPAAQP